MSTSDLAPKTGAELSPGAVWPPYSPPTAELDPHGLPILVKGDGVWLTGKDGSTYLDGIGALEAMAVGHGRTRLVEVAARQMQELAFLDVFRYSSEPVLELAEKLIAMTPPGMKVARAELPRRLMGRRPRHRHRATHAGLPVGSCVKAGWAE